MATAALVSNGDVKAPSTGRYASLYSEVQNTRLDHPLPLPSVLRGPFKVVDDEIAKLFPCLYGQPSATLVPGDLSLVQGLKIGVVLSGGQAPGGHNVISGIYGFDMICSGRDKIETPEQFKQAEDTAVKLDLDGLVVIGGDDSNTNACLLAENFRKKKLKTRVIGCPKTIDGDLKCKEVPTSFGFDTACKIYAEMIGNVMVDARSTGKYYHFVRLMGRAASHITLECALQTHPNITLIGEEVQHLIAELNEILAHAIVDEAGVWKEKLTPESFQLFNLLPPAIQDQLMLERDPHGNVQVAKIETEKMLIQMVETELESRKNTAGYKNHFKGQSHFFGYEGRCGLPSNFDSTYCYALGYGAGALLQSGKTGLISSVGNLTAPVGEWTVGGTALTSLMDVERRHGKFKPVIKKAMVELEGAPFKKFASLREEWALQNRYFSPGPIQFFGPTSDKVNHTLLLELGAQV
ncbi:pyrophosphate--fructose 6-phosphate 1-phosphotransferase subunit beta-like [Dorcoceras hygrometricum]|uniref:Pyrophosphate--fructose 6-phosphate 1-phosphotransferase subunit beta-like n=1 Tax=Dorcoceras hygrometricum TaxID=472368 RepID=A0A2Z7A4V9_9LAMI|nr:pyrophosphate--fructose 6-phosphate 1-phosphotransferase subunit beta-like [Dorcoceras hygrometricum]